MVYHRKSRRGGISCCTVAFCTGLLAASICSSSMLIVLLAVAVIILGCLK